MKRTIYISIITSLVVAMSIVLFPLSLSARTFVQYEVPYSYQIWNEPIYLDTEYVVQSGSLTMNASSFMAYYHNNISQGSLTNVDDQFPVMICISSTNTDSIFGLSTSLVCAKFDTSSLNADLDQLINTLIGLSNGTININNSGMFCYTVGQLENLDYRLYDKVSLGYNTVLGSNAYLYVIAKYKMPDQIDYTGGFTGSINYTFQVNQNSARRNYYRIDFDFTLAKDSNNNYPFFDEDWNGYFSFVCPSVVASNNQLFDTYNCQYTSNGTVFSNSDIGCSMIFTSISLNSSGVPSSSGTGTVSATYIEYTGSNTDLTGINNKLNSIIDLLSDFGVEINENIYQDITNNYNINIENLLSNHINNLQVNLNNFDTTDNLTQANKNVIGNLANLTMDTFDILDNNNLEIIYILPLALIILGAVIL